MRFCAFGVTGMQQATKNQPFTRDEAPCSRELPLAKQRKPTKTKPSAKNWSRQVGRRKRLETNGH
eukprot:5298106-Amphidinium_carterae.1